ncbi:hypothetical protein QCA50_006080 [Cerrena zonata]|uniref:Uncharacterized protein n=1 Tax=Cerrena zonata TaxID=2478898 RepID=A0AAW0GGW2_9APHY
MLGTKIIEDYSIIEPVDPGTPVPARGLTVRPSKASGLRIVTAHEMARDQPLRVPHDKHLLHSTSSLMASLITPTSTHTFGVPDPTWKRRPVSSVVSLSLSFEDRESRRISRYSREEGRSQIGSAIMYSGACRP